MFTVWTPSEGTFLKIDTDEAVRVSSQQSLPTLGKNPPAAMPCRHMEHKAQPLVAPGAVTWEVTEQKAQDVPTLSEFSLSSPPPTHAHTQMRGFFFF